MSATSLISCLGSEDNGLLIVNWSSSGGIGITEFASCRQRGHQYSPLLTAKFPVISCVCSNKHKLSSISCPNVQPQLSIQRCRPPFYLCKNYLGHLGDTLLLEYLLYIHVLYFKNSYETAKNSDRYMLIGRIIETREKGHSQQNLVICLLSLFEI